METVVVNLMGGPGVGKSTICARIFTELKSIGMDCEMALEYAKDVVYEENYQKLDNQIYIFAKQHQRVFKLIDKVKVIITDSPLLNSIVYDKSYNPALRNLVVHEFKKLNNLNFYLERDVIYNPNGRMQTLDEAIKVDNGYLDLLNSLGVDYIRITFGEAGI
jgi:nicotinamide riboside kinase